MEQDKPTVWTAPWPPIPLSLLIQAYFALITGIAILAATLAPLRQSILAYGKLNHPHAQAQEKSPRTEDPVDPSHNALTSTTTTATTTAKQRNYTQHNTRFVDAITNSPISPPLSSSFSQPPASAFVETLRSITVPKQWFAHFYVFAIFWTAFLTIDLSLYQSQHAPPEAPSFWTTNIASTTRHESWSLIHNIFIPLKLIPGGQDWQPYSTPLNGYQWTVHWSAMNLYSIQLSRRWYESLFVERPSAGARIHLGHYLVGISFYAIMAPSLWIDLYMSQHQQQPQQPQDQIGQSRAAISWGFLGFGVALFVWASVHQYRCHVILANLRPKQSVKASTTLTTTTATKEVYKVPSGDWFEKLVTPHYVAEMLIYFSFWIVASSAYPVSNPTFFLTANPCLVWSVIWVVVNLGIVSRESSLWYRARFGPDWEKNQNGKYSKRWILIPYVY